MKTCLAAIVWGVNRVAKIPSNLMGLAARMTTPVVRGRVMCWAYNFKQYSCNPRYLSEYLAAHNEPFDVYWVLRKGISTNNIDPNVKIVRYRSWEYYRLVASAEFLVTNIRTEPYKIGWRKRKCQKYLSLWHGGMALKRIEKDAEQSLTYAYLRRAKADSRVADLMISGCRFHTSLIEQKFWYDGEILEKGIPRNDIFFDDEATERLRGVLAQRYGIADDEYLVLYAPTFRTSRSIEPYRIDWANVISAIEKRSGGKKVRVMLRLHPLLLGNNVSSLLVNHQQVIDMTAYHDMQELLRVSDMLITDYSSSMFDFSMQMRPCLLYATDVEQYDRGYYFDFSELPYPLARNQQELIEIIDSFDEEKYKVSTQKFFDEKVGLVENGNASKHIAEWMREHRMK
ncbi:MAG: CDP-glycerol glycerophosphotransferase family protein [Tidjanibacter sp.]|nr:CDP-glycerol glycerophosphotransferase family protein [Tidjanibacter sp.]